MRQELYNDVIDLFSFTASENGEEKPAEIVQDEDFVLEQFRNPSLPFDHRFELKTEARLLQTAYANNKILSLSNSRTQILAHQVESTHRIVNSLDQRYLLADEVGLGKTIEAGLVIKELIFRHGYSRILVVCPASLLFQWQSELKTKFNEDFQIIDRKGLNRGRRSLADRSDNPWSLQGKVICSMDFIKSKSFADDLKNTEWDAVIIDEAHRMRRDSQKSTMAYNVGEILSERTKALMLLTATPFQIGRAHV